MPRRITNLIREGLPSKIYLLAFNGPVSGYEIAKKIYGVEKYPPTAKVMVWLKKLVAEGIVSKTEEGYRSNVEPLVDEIAVALRSDHDVELSDFEKYVLEKTVDYLRFHILNRDFFLHKGYFLRETDAARELMDGLGSYMMLSSLISRKEFKITTTAEFDEKLKKYKDQTGFKEEEMVPLTDVVPRELRDNLSKLSSFYALFQRISRDGLTHDLLLLWMKHETERIEEGKSSVSKS